MKKQKTQNHINLETLAGGAFAEKLNKALVEVAENIQDPNTEATAKRTITISLKFAPNKNRQLVNASIAITSKLAAAEAIDTQIVMGTNLKTGAVEIAEYDSTQGQLSMYDAIEDEEPDEEQEPAQAPYNPTDKVLDLRKRTKAPETNTVLVPGRDYDTETGEVYEELGQLKEKYKIAAQA